MNLNPPYSEGPYDCKICFIGEAPGRTEERKQRPFVGRAGTEILNPILSRASINRVSCRIENLLQYRPRDNKIEYEIDISRRALVITNRASAELAETAYRLSRCKANVFVPLGNVPMWFLTGLKSITKRRGSILEATLPEIEGKKVIPTIHPAAALRQYINRWFISNDIRRVKKESEFPDIRLMKRNLLLEPSYSDVIAFIKECITDAVSFDIEVHREELSHLSFAVCPDVAICIPFFDKGAHNYTPEEEAHILLAVSDILKDDRIVKIGQNLFFDTSFMFEKYGMVTHNIDDTMVACGVCYPDFPKSLEFITSIYCNGEPYYKDERKIWERNPFDSALRFRRYNAMDSTTVIEAFPTIMRDLKRHHNIDTYEKQKMLIEPLVFMRSKGICMDAEGLKEASAEATEEINELQKELNTLAGMELNPNSWKQVRGYLYVIKGIKPRTKDGKVTSDETALTRIAATGVKEADLILRLRHLVKMRGTYYDVKLSPDGRLRCSYNPVGTKEGRPSSSMDIFGLGTNLLNQPKRMKALMRPDSGYIWVNIDQMQAESRVVANIANELKMLDAFEKRKDLHKLTAGLIFGKPPEEISDEPGSSPLGSGELSERGWGKKGGHALDYGFGRDSFADKYQVTRQIADMIISKYHIGYPGIKQWWATIRGDLSANNKTLVNCYGRHRRFMGRWGQDLFREAYAYIPQSSVADKTRDTIIYIYYTPEPLFKRLELLNTVYDSIVFQYPLEDIGNLYQAIKLIMVKITEPVPWRGKEFVIPAECTLGFNGADGMKFSSYDIEETSDTIMTKRIKEYVRGNLHNGGGNA